MTNDVLIVFSIGCFLGAFICMLVNSKMFRDWRVRRQQRKWNKSKNWFRG